MTFEDKENFRLDGDLKQLIDHWCKQYPDRWESRSQFIRSAIFRFSRDLTKEKYEKVQQ